jgi:predicted ATPase
MLFKVVQRFPNLRNQPPDTIFLVWDNWNDYSYYTYFGIRYLDLDSVVHDIGGVRIGYVGQEKGPSAKGLNVGQEFPKLGDGFFSLGAGTDYYENLKRLNKETRESILEGLRDIAFLPELLEEARYEDVTTESLLRGLDLKTVSGQYRRIALGGAKLTNFKFWFDSPKFRPESPEMKLSFKITPESTPPTNVHVIIGRNGVGKTNMINNMNKSLYGEQFTDARGVYFNEDDEKFTNVISVSFSAFDTTLPYFDDRSEGTDIVFKFIGLKKPDSESEIGFQTKSGDELEDEFTASFLECIESFKTASLRKSLNALESDPNFREADILQLLEIPKKSIAKRGKKLFNKLSSGHKIILLSITRLVETVQEKSLVFIDEPEAHLHPPLLSAFTRSLSELLIDLNGVAIIATHSPVILQEVPKKCVYKLRRYGANASAERPEIETFGENVGVLTREIFGLEVTESGFYQLLKKAVAEFDDFDNLLDHFDDQLGMEGRSIARVLLANKTREDQ